MNISYIETFLSVVHHQTFTEAAEDLLVPQPTVSSRIQNLEKVLEVTLFQREKRKTVLTEEGKRFLPYAQQMMELIERAKTSLHQSSHQPVIIASTLPFTHPLILERIMKIFQLDIESMGQISLVSQDDRLMKEQLLNGTIHFAFTHEPIYHPDISCEKIGSETLAFYASREHPVLQTSDAVVSFLDLRDVTLIACPPFYNQQVKELFSLYHLFQANIIECREVDVLIQLLIHNMGVTLVPLSLFGRAPKEEPASPSLLTRLSLKERILLPEVSYYLSYTNPSA